MFKYNITDAENEFVNLSLHFGVPGSKTGFG